MDIEETPDSATPRTLLNSLLLQQSPVETLRQPVRQLAHTERNPAVAVTPHQKEPEEESRRTIEEKPPEVGSKDLPVRETVNLSTPRTIISEVLENSNAIKTVRVPVQQIARTNLPQEKPSREYKHTATTDGDTTEIKFEKIRRVKRIRLEDINLSAILSADATDDGSLAELIGKRDVEPQRRSEISLQVHSSHAVQTKSLQRRSLATVNTSTTSKRSASKLKDELLEKSSKQDTTTKINTVTRDIATSTDADLSILPNESLDPKQTVVVEKIDAEDAVSASREHFDEPEKNKSDVVEKRHSDSADESEIEHALINQSTMVEGMAENKSTAEETIQEEKSSPETIVTASYTDGSSEIGPLGLSSIIAEAEVSKGSATKKQQTMDKFLSHSTQQDPQPVAGAHHEESEEDASHNGAIGIADDAIEQIVPDNQHSEAKRRKHTQPVQEEVIATSSSTAPRKKVGSKRKTAQKKSTYNLPFPKSQFTGIVQHYSSLKISKEAYQELEKISDRYFARTAVKLERSCRKNNRKTVGIQDVKDLMKRRGHINTRNSFNVLVEENLPQEYRQELIPAARAGSVVYP